MERKITHKGHIVKFLYRFDCTCISFEQHRWCKSWHARLECGRSWVRVPISSNQRLYNWYLLLLF